MDAKRNPRQGPGIPRYPIISKALGLRPNCLCASFNRNADQKTSHEPNFWQQVGKQSVDKTAPHGPEPGNPLRWSNPSNRLRTALGAPGLFVPLGKAGAAAGQRLAEAAAVFGGFED